MKETIITSPATSSDAGPDAERGVRRRENTRARLLDAALDVFADRGLRRVTVDDLVGAAGFTRGAFYSNFSSIDELFFAVFERGATRMLDLARDSIAAVPEGEFTLASIGDVLDSTRRYGRRWYVLQAELRLLALRDEQAREVLAAFSRRLRGDLVEVIDDVLHRLGRTAVLPLDQLAEIVVALHLHALGHNHLGETTLGAEGLDEDVLSSLVLGFSHDSS